jgi:predicted AAA+ superfamily ATPase
MSKNPELPRRIYWSFIKEDLKKKMVFIGGPRQVGKTTMALGLLDQRTHDGTSYLNWDNELHRRVINNQTWSKEIPLIVFDELHKKKNWQTFIKGVWDVWKGHQNYVVTGSAQLDVFRKSGDSMMGRYHYYRIHPYSFTELKPTYGEIQALELLWKYGGFPEPLLEQSEVGLRRWHMQRVSKLVRVDLRDLENVSDFDKVEILADTLQSRVGSPLSYKSLSEDLETSDKTVKRWVQILDSLYFCFLISPFESPKIKAVKKSQKLYLWDWSQVEDLGARFENMVALQLLKYCHFIQDTEGYRMELRYIRDATGKECDFVVLKDRKPLFAVECKLTDLEIAPSLLVLKSKIHIPHWYQVSLKEKIRRIDPDLSLLPFAKFCEETGMV